MSYAKYKDLGNGGGDSNPERKNIVYNEAPVVDDPSIQIKGKEHKLSIISNGNNRIVVIYVYASWCVPCKSLHGRFAQLVKSNKNENLVLMKQDIDLGMDIISPEIKGVPSFEFYKDGKIVKTITGTGSALNEVIDQINIMLTELVEESKSSA